MNSLLLIFEMLAVFAVSLSVVMSVLLILKLKWPAPVSWILKIYVSALSPVIMLIAFLVFSAGLATSSFFISMLGAYSLAFYTFHYLRVTGKVNKASGFEQAFGSRWMDHINPLVQRSFLQSTRFFRLPALSKGRIHQNIVFATIPETNRELLCDLWMPPDSVPASGLAFIFMHGSAYYLLDKDCGTRPFFRYLAAQGHLIMDVAYRLSPETDMMGMVNDVKRAISWMKENAGNYGADAGKIILGGGSAGGHLALLAAYTSKDPLFSPAELTRQDLDVMAVIAVYPASDLKSLYYHTHQHLITRSSTKQRRTAAVPGWVRRLMGKDFKRLGFDKGFENAGALAPLLGGDPVQCAQSYAFYSPGEHIHPDCPPTLLIHGEHDVMAPVNATRELYSRLVKNSVPVVMHILPQADHAFDLVLPRISPSAHTMLYDIERFMGYFNNYEKSEPHLQVETEHEYHLW
jgi:acetyl esterase/lipase